MSTIRLDKLLSNLGYGSRKEAAILVRQGRVMLKAVVLKRHDDAIALSDVRAGLITLDGEVLDAPSPFTLMLNKPAGFICSHDEKGRLVYDLLPERWQARNPQLSCAGRLDKESTGQVIITDDGELLHRIIHPKSHAVKYYNVTLDKPLWGVEAQLFSSGEFLMAGDTKPLKPAVWLATSEREGTIQLQEGRFHQIRRMFETIGNNVLSLHRFQTGGLPLGDIKEGEYCILTETDIASIFLVAAG
jgi:16S rRNA pseudouridine516 synthase